MLRSFCNIHDNILFYDAAVTTIDNGGTSKPIEQIRPGDMVLVVDHKYPELDTPKPSKVTRFFNNGQKDVVTLIVENHITKEYFEVTCTPSHRFYIKEKCWTTAQSLISCEQRTSANGSSIVSVSREELQWHSSIRPAQPC